MHKNRGIILYISNNVAERIKQTSKEKGIPLKKVLENAGLGFNTMSNMKTSMPKADNLAKIADCLDVSVDYLLGRTDNPEINKSNEKTHIIKIAARNGSYKELALNDEELEELQRKINSLPEATDL